jgi:hypothetical protein
VARGSTFVGSHPDPCGGAHVDDQHVAVRQGQVDGRVLSRRVSYELEELRAGFHGRVFRGAVDCDRSHLCHCQRLRGAPAGPVTVSLNEPVRARAVASGEGEC